ncbi:flavin-dependent dehydrogenase [Streptomyces sp. 1114.5]|uniref:FAD-dependent oxidoreductase n=1 Tax=unclassified Streptomyces TaxID=2593676 RepID=UPI000BD3913C|nr:MULTISPECIES: FAD-dependent oxidoreductase [unclassified Streptomyces]RKT19394.1 flavin-dependent dehydrogenase [Streptomyces sp. 1114.5]SOB85590.1 Dehydrogenase (flavoprotein) [Streptomyces sp. 1331.2]
MGTRTDECAVVLGGSIAGLLAARVLSESYPRVVIVERDKILGTRGPRRGVPHGNHAHGLVARGHQIMESLFPGLTDELIAAGVRPGDFSGDIRWYFNGLRLRQARTGLPSVPATRPVLEHHLRERVRALPEVTFLEEHDIIAPVADADGRRVTGVRVQQRTPGAEERTLDAHLVVDTTGRGSRTPLWLAELGYDAPPEERIEIDLAYTTRHYRLDKDPFGSEIAIIPAATPSHPRGAFFYRVPGDDNRVELSVTGIVGDHPPTDPEGFHAYVRSLPAPEIHEAIRDAEPLDEPLRFRFPASVRRDYHRLERFPEGLLVMGDAVCSFNPAYAQGMTSAALQALVLRRHTAGRRLPRHQAFFRDVAREIRAPWSFAAVSDLGYPGVKGRRTVQTVLVNRYVGLAQRAAVRDARVTDALVRIAGLVASPQSLMRPRTLLRVLLAARRPVPPSALGGPTA